MKGNGLMDKLMEKDSFIILMGNIILDIGKMMIMKAKEGKFGQINLIMMVNICKEKDMEMEFLCGIMEVFIVENLKITK